MRAAGAITDETRMVVVGSQAILGSVPDPPAELAASMEVDLYPEAAPEKADLIDGSIGELSMFHDTFGYYAHGVGPETALLPEDWKHRAVRLQTPGTGGVEGLFPSLSDLAVSKLAAGRDKDVAFVSGMLRHGIIQAADVERLLPRVAEPWRRRIQSRLRASAPHPSA